MHRILFYRAIDRIACVIRTVSTLTVVTRISRKPAA